MEKDEEKLMSRRRLEKWGKIFLIFLAFVWLCTIISKSIYVSGLTVVKTDTPSKKYVEHIVEADGIVTTGGEIAVNTLSGLRVDRLYVMQGDEVKAGDVLFTVDLTDMAELIRAKETELSKLQCNLSDFQVNEVIDAQKKEVAILWAQEDYETADKETTVAKERAKEALDKAEAELGKHLADTVPYTSDRARGEAWETYHDWVNSGYDISDRVTAKEREIRDLEEQLAQLGEGKTLSGAAGGQETGDVAENGNDASTDTGADNGTGAGNIDSVYTNTDDIATDSKDSADNDTGSTVTVNKDSVESNADNTIVDSKDSVDNNKDNTEIDNKDNANSSTDNTDNVNIIDSTAADNNTNVTQDTNNKGDSDTKTEGTPDGDGVNQPPQMRMQQSAQNCRKRSERRTKSCLPCRTS